MFIDKAKIYVCAGKGGDGCLSFHREKYVPKGGPDGGSGGKGGDIYLQSDPQISTLYDLNYQPHFRAKNGSPGRENNRHGKNAEDMVIKVPTGTLIYKNNKLVADLNQPYQKILIVSGGRGGRGNASFKSQHNKAPRISEKGQPGETAVINLELKLIADVGILGLPNAGKSTLLARITSARPKIADYPFTTISPNLGVVSHKGKSFVVADIPGLIEGAHQGKGLGDEFLRHIERTRILLHLVDISGFENKSADRNFVLINKELVKYSSKLTKKPMLVVANKMDLTGAKERLAKLIKKFPKQSVPVRVEHPCGIKDILDISAVTGKGINKLLNRIIHYLDRTPQEALLTQETVKKYIFEPEFTIYKQGNIFIVKGKKVENLVSMTNFNQEEAVLRLQNILKKMGLEKHLKKQGIKENNIVRIGKYEFNYLDDTFS